MKVLRLCLDSGKQKFQNKSAIILIVEIRFMPSLNCTYICILSLLECDVGTESYSLYRLTVQLCPKTKFRRDGRPRLNRKRLSGKSNKSPLFFFFFFIYSFFISACTCMCVRRYVCMCIGMYIRNKFLFGNISTSLWPWGRLSL
jgi:hypothetical protein